MCERRLLHEPHGEQRNDRERCQYEQWCEAGDHGCGVDHGLEDLVRGASRPNSPHAVHPSPAQPAIELQSGGDPSQAVKQDLAFSS